MADSHDLYELLGVERDADADALKAAYRARAKECHPDVAGDDPKAAERFRTVEEAYRVLSNAESRAIYDETGQYDSQKIAQVELRAFAVVGQMIEQFLESGFDPDQAIFEDTIKDSIEQQLKGFHQVIPSVQLKLKRAKRLGAMSKRSENAKGGDIVQQVVERKISAFNKQLDDLDMSIAVAKRAKEIMADYEFEREREMYLTFGFGNGNSTSSAGGFFSGR